jgi:hypothetical protein
LSKNLFGLAHHAACGDMPDPIGHADLLHCHTQYAEDLNRHIVRKDFVCGTPRRLPLPNGPDKLRSLSLLEPRDELLLRAVAGVVLERTTSVVDSDRVFSYQTSKRLGTWGLRGGKGIDWNALNRKGLSLMRSSKPEVVLQRDVKSYYESCAASAIHRWMGEDLRLPDVLVQWTSQRLAVWESSGFPGLPIGSEFSAIVGTAYLFSVDDVLSAHPAVLHHLRVTDDFFIAMQDAAHVGDVDDVLCNALAGRGLSLNDAKSEVLTLEQAIDRFEEREREYWRAQLGGDPKKSDETIVAMLTQLACDPLQDLGLSRYVLGAARRGKVTAAIPVVLGAATLLELCPTMCGDLLTCLPGAATGFVDELMTMLEEPGSVRTAARNLHLIRSLPDGGLGSAEGQVLRAIALDPHEPIPVRAWALYRACSTPVFNLSERADLALDGSTDAFLERAVIVSFRGDGSAGRTKVLSDPRITSGPLQYSGRWALAA